jgi:parallel beta-helix repeat protein
MFLTATPPSLSSASAKPATIHNINTGLNYTSIQEAINAKETLNGHTISIEAGIYYEHVVINKSITLLGQDKYNTIIDGENSQHTIYITTNNAKIENLTLRHSGFGYSGIQSYNTSNGNITDVNIENCYYGIQLYNCTKTTVHANFISNCQYGIRLYNSKNNNIYANTALRNKNGIHIDISNNNIIHQNNISLNSWNGIYLYSSSNNTISQNNLSTNTARGIRLHNSSNNTIQQNNITKNPEGIHLYQSNSNTLSTNAILNNTNGIWLSHSNGNIILSNTIAFNKQYGLHLLNSSYTKVFHNNFINNTNKNVEQPSNTSIVNMWDNFFEGNYWSDHKGLDTNKDGISDTAYIIDQRTWLGIHSKDNHPLMAPFQKTSLQIQNHTYTIETISNSTITQVQHYQSVPDENKTLTIKLANSNKKGFIRICIPHQVVTPPYIIKIDGLTASYNNTLRTNGTHTWLYIEYSSLNTTATLTITHKLTITPPIPPTPIWQQWPFWGILFLTIFAAALIGINMKYRKTVEKQKSLIKDYEQKLQKTSYLGIASELFKKDVERRENKLAEFGEKYGVKITPRKNLEDIIRSVKSKDKERKNESH